MVLAGGAGLLLLIHPDNIDIAINALVKHFIIASDFFKFRLNPWTHSGRDAAGQAAAGFPWPCRFPSYTCARKFLHVSYSPDDAPLLDLRPAGRRVESD